MPTILTISEIQPNPLREMAFTATEASGINDPVTTERLKMTFDAPIPPDTLNKIIALLNVKKRVRNRKAAK